MSKSINKKVIILHFLLFMAINNITDIEWGVDPSLVNWPN